MKSAVDKWWWLVKRLPRRTRIELLEALAYPEFEVTRTWLVSDSTASNGVRVEQIPLAAAVTKEAEARTYIALGAPMLSQAQLRRKYDPMRHADWHAGAGW